MKAKVWTVTLDGDNCPIGTEVFATEAAARAHLVEALESYSVRLSLGKDDDLAVLAGMWERVADGVCAIEEHELELAPAADREARVAAAIKQAWQAQGEVPFPLYDREALELARAAIAAA